MKSRLGQLKEKLNKSGIAGNPVISDAELDEMVLLYKELVDIMDDTNNQTMRGGFLLEMQLVQQVIQNRCS